MTSWPPNPPSGEPSETDQAVAAGEATDQGPEHIGVTAEASERPPEHAEAAGEATQHGTDRPPEQAGVTAEATDRPPEHAEAASEAIQHGTDRPPDHAEAAGEAVAPGLPTMAELDELSAELDGVDAVLARMDDPAGG